MDVATLEDTPLQCLETSSVDHSVSRTHILEERRHQVRRPYPVEMPSTLVTLTRISSYEANQRWRGFRRVRKKLLLASSCPSVCMEQPGFLWTD